MNYQNIKYGRAAEWQRGQVGLELFKSKAEVEENGGSVTAGLTINNKVSLDRSIKKISYNNLNTIGPNGMTILLKLKLNSLPLGAEGIISQSTAVWANANWAMYIFTDNHITFANINSASTIKGVTSNYTLTTDEVDVAVVVNYATTTITMYIDGVYDKHLTDAAINNNKNLDIPTTIGQYYTGGNSCDGDVSNVRIFNEPLSAEEILAYSNGTMWDYDKDCVLWLDGKLDSYDPTNVRALDRSMQKNHLTFGDGATSSTFPTKLTERPGGYSFDGTSDYLSPQNDIILSDNKASITFFIKNPLTAINFIVAGETNETFEMHTNTNGTLRTLMNTGSSLVDFVGALTKNTLDVFTLTIDSSTQTLFKNGSLLEKKTSGVSTLPADGKIRIGARYNGSYWFFGDIYGFAVHNCTLNQMQAIDVNIRMEQDRRV